MTTLDVLRLPLGGSRLIEASAGTGKTWTIAALYLRLVLGHHGEVESSLRALLPGDILVMTFTRAATRELSDRIRAKLVEAARWFRADDVHDVQAVAPEPFLADLRAAYPAGRAREQAAFRLAMAAESMDDAAIHTIDAWCQRMLREHAFDSGQLFDETLESDENVWLDQALRDYWRREIYPLRPVDVARVLAVWPGLPACAADVRAWLARWARKPQDVSSDPPFGLSLSKLLSQQTERLNVLKAGWVERTQSMRIWLFERLHAKTNPFNGVKLRMDTVSAVLTALERWALDEAVDRPDFSPEGARQRGREDRLRPQNLLDALKKGQSVDLPPVFAEYDALLTTLAREPDLHAQLALHAAKGVAERIAALKRQQGCFGFADLLERLNHALLGPQGERLRQRIVTQFPAALIDEFQDTSKRQMQLFEGLYRPASNDPKVALLLIGDPKQSIYGFRGADIYSYLQARQATAPRHHALGVNHRSATALVQAVNQLFERAEMRNPGGAFALVDRQGRPGLPFEAVQAKGRAERWVTGPERLPAPALSIHAETRAWKAAEALRRGAAHCAEAIVARLADPDAGFMGVGRPWVRLAPRDIAVLVRSRREADAVRQALQRRGVASVYLSDQNSVFASPEAADLLLWLRAVASPLDQRLARAALAGGTFGLPLAELARQVQDDAAWDASLALLRQLHGVWQRQGVLALVRQTLHGRGLPAQWLAQSAGERRLTNVLHLAELLQAASQKLDGGPALLRWFSDQIAEPEGGRDEQIVRLESEADLVQVVTVHKSKGLEYPLVFVPFAASVRRGGKGDGQGGDATDSEDPDDERLDQEALREDIRLLYVALTRARHALWLGLVPPSATTAKADPQGVGATTVTRSALGWLLAGAEIVADDAWQIKAPDLPALLGQVWSPEAPASPELFHLSLATEAGGALPCTLWQARSLPPLVLDAPAYQARFERDWAIGSFSAWVRDLDHHDPEDMAFDSDGAGFVSVRPESLPAVHPELVEGPAWHRFPRGSEAGRFIHACLQGLAQAGLASVHTSSFAESLQRRCDLQNPQSPQGGGWSAETLVPWLQTIVETPLPGLSAPLSAADRVLAEMEFWMPAPTASLQQLDGVCRRHGWPGLDRPALTQGVQNGLMMGFADLVIEHAGRYWVLDYKSNHLGERDGAYTERALVHAVLQHRYDVQAALYLMALHRLLRQRLGAAYAPERHLGGAMVLFVRGIQGPCAGTVLLPATVAWLADLDGLWAKEPL
ncbi:MAG: exodeoxyribonuclease V subunit beta [Leptothrix ochracea]|uniref:exodeoxyribonuclease V subunit beta n=1 Tax=Leptothrix ochracea TaxID=735331 RepID=UPI0034E1C19F